MSDTEDYDGRDEEYAEEDEERNDADSEEREEDEEHEDADTAVGQDEQPADISEVAEEEEEDNEAPLVLEKEWEGFVRIKVPSAFALPPPPPASLGDTTLPEPMDETAIGGDSPRGRGQDEDSGAEGDVGYDGDDGEEGDQEVEEQEREYASAPKVPFASIKHPPLQDARVYFQMDARVDRTMPPWMRYVLTNEPHFFDTLMAGKKVERPEDRAAAIALKKKLALKEAKKKAKAAKRKKKKIVEEEEEEVVPEPKEEIQYDDDGHVVISHPFEGNTRFRLIQLTKSRPANTRYNLPEIVVDDDELVFIAVAMDAVEVEVEESAWETEGAASLTPAPTGRAAAVLPTEVAVAVSKLHPPRDVSGARTPGQEEDGEGGDREEGEEVDEEAEEDESRIKSSMSITGQVLDEENEEEEEDVDGEPAKRGMEMRMDVMTLAALFCPRAFERGLMRHETLPNMALTTAWLEIYSDRMDGGTLAKEFRNMQAHIVEGSSSALTTKKTSRKPKEQEDNANDDDEDRAEEVAPPVDESQLAPPVAPYAVRGEDGSYIIPKPKMDLSWTFIKERHFPILRREMRALRRAVGAHLLPTAPILPSTVCTTPEMTLSYLDYLVAIPRSALLGWTKSKLDDTPEEDIEDTSEIALDPLSEEHLERPLSHMLGSILLDLRRRQIRKVHGKRDMKLGAFAAHKQALTTKFMESNTLLDPLVTARYAVNTLFEEAEEAIRSRHMDTKTTFLQSWRAAADGEGPSPTAADSGAESDDVPSYWPSALRLYDSDLVALACARYGALDTFQEILRIKVEHVSPPRLVDDTVGTYHLLLQLLPHLTEQCASYLLHFAANCVPVVPILTDHSILTHFDFLDTLAQIDPSVTIPADDADGEDPYKTIDGLSTKSTTLPRVIARNFWHRWAEDDGFMSALRDRASMVYDEVSLEITKFRALLEAIIKHEITPSELDAKVLSTGGGGEDENDDIQGGKMEVRDVYSPVVMYHAIHARNIPIIVHLATKHGIITVQESLTTGAASVMEFIIEDDARRNADASDKPLSSRSTEDLLATHEERADGALSILLALVDNGMPMSKEVFRRGVKGYISTLQDTFGKCKKLTQLIKRLNQREHERGTDPAQKYGILRYVPEHPKLAASPSKRVAMKYIAAPVDE